MHGRDVRVCRSRAMERLGAMNLLGNRGWVVGLAVAFGAMCFGTALRAQEQEQGQGPGQPARAVRLSYVDGQVTLSQGGQVLAQQAVANAPLLEGMQLTTADSGKAEIQFEDGSVVRLPPDSSLTLQVLQGAGATANAVLVLNSGLAYFEFQGGTQAGQISVEFGGTQLSTSGFTVLRVNIDNPPGAVAVFSGNAHLESDGGNVSVDLHGGEGIALNGASPANYQIAESIAPDSWDAWNSDRDQALSEEAASQTGAPANLGEPQNPAWNDLDANGDWYDVPGQGYIWSPFEAASAAFDPYGFGNWMWTPGYGYLWISGYPWGYLPFQCGAWDYFNGFGWGWAPGPGGCSPWWGLGFYGGPTFGVLPPGYKPIPRPIMPRRPINGRAVPMVAVNRSPVMGGSPLPARNRTTPVTIGGSTVVALHPLASLPVVEHAPLTADRNQAEPGNDGTPPAGRPGTASRPGYNSRPPSEAPASASPSTESHGSAPSRSSYSGGGSASHSNGGGSAGGGSPHPSGGSSGGGASHSSGGGGGGGGGGGSHGGGGGGGGHK